MYEEHWRRAPPPAVSGLASPEFGFPLPGKRQTADVITGLMPRPRGLFVIRNDASSRGPIVRSIGYVDGIEGDMHQAEGV
jgi:hypothetical protein